MKAERIEQAEFAMWAGIAGSIILALMKGTIGLMAGSKVLIADAAHSASDAAGSIALMTGKDASRKYPGSRPMLESRSKAAPIAAIIISVFLLAAGIEVAVHAAKSFFSGNEEAPPDYPMLAVIISILATEAMFQYKFRMGKKLSSKVLIAGASRHRSDVYSSIAVFAGVGGAMLGSYIQQPFLYYLDPAAGIVVSLLIIKMGYTQITDSIRFRSEPVIHQENDQELMKAALGVKGVVAVDSLQAREQGHYVIVDVIISVNPRISVVEGHDVGKAVKSLLMDRFSHVSDVLIHVNPYDPGYPYKSNDDAGQEDFPTLLH